MSVTLVPWLPGVVPGPPAAVVAPQAATQNNDGQQHGGDGTLEAGARRATERDHVSLRVPAANPALSSRSGPLGRSHVGGEQEWLEGGEALGPFGVHHRIYSAEAWTNLQ